MDLYSVTLALALAAASAALASAVYGWLGSAGVLAAVTRSRARRVARWAGITALGLLVVSTSHHVAGGHRPGSASGPAALLLLRIVRPADATS